MKGRTCDNCLYQRYVMTEKGEAWFCRRSYPRWYATGMELHYENAKGTVCTFEGEE